MNRSPMPPRCRRDRGRRRIMNVRTYCETPPRILARYAPDPWSGKPGKGPGHRFHAFNDGRFRPPEAKWWR